jgi:FkbM family methyltransferase
VKPKTFFRLAEGFTPYVTAEIDGLLLLLPTHDRSRGKLFWKRALKEQPALDRALAELERAGIPFAGTTFVDVGANIGTTTLAALRAGFTAVIACEPELENVRLLRANVALNGERDRVRVHRVAVSDRAGTVTLDVVPGRTGLSYVVSDSEAPLRGQPQEVPAARLDDLVDPGDVGLLWIDVEGHEGRVLAGARRLVERSIPLVLELNPKGLRRTGGSDVLADVLRRHYTHLLDLRTEGSEVVPSDAIGELVRERDVRGRATDLLAFCT